LDQGRDRLAGIGHIYWALFTVRSHFEFKSYGDDLQTAKKDVCAPDMIAGASGLRHTKLK
jgi:hypothetical protein